MAYPRADCPVCKRNTAVAPRSRRYWRHDPVERDPELRSCAGSYALYIPGPGETGYCGDQPRIFEI